MYSVPFLYLFFSVFWICKKVDIYDCFYPEPKWGLIHILVPSYRTYGGNSYVRESGCLELITNSNLPVTNLIHMPPEVVPLSFLRPISGSAALATVTDIFEHLGPDSMQGKIASIMMELY